MKKKPQLPSILKYPPHPLINRRLSDDMQNQKHTYPLATGSGPVCHAYVQTSDITLSMNSTQSMHALFMLRHAHTHTNPPFRPNHSTNSVHALSPVILHSQADHLHIRFITTTPPLPTKKKFFFFLSFFLWVLTPPSICPFALNNS